MVIFCHDYLCIATYSTIYKFIVIFIRLNQFEMKIRCD